VTSSSYGPSEEETCRQFVLPALDRAGWGEEQIRDGTARAPDDLRRPPQRPLLQQGRDNAESLTAYACRLTCLFYPFVLVFG
jgi:hypothetical protein